MFPDCWMMTDKPLLCSQQKKARTHRKQKKARTHRKQKKARTQKKKLRSEREKVQNVIKKRSR